MGGGVLVPLGTAVPWGDSPKVQGGPWAPPPCGDKSSETLLVLCLVFVRFLWDGCWVFCVVFWSLGLEFCLVWCPLGPDPCQPRCLFVPSLSLVVWYVRRRRFSLFLSLSGAGETQTPFGVWDSPCVSSSWTRVLRPRPVHLAFHLQLGQVPAPVFFFSSSSLAGMVRSGCSCSGSCRSMVAGLVFLVCLGCVGFVACRCIMH